MDDGQDSRHEVPELLLLPDSTVALRLSLSFRAREAMKPSAISLGVAIYGMANIGEPLTGPPRQDGLDATSLLIYR